MQAIVIFPRFRGLNKIQKIRKRYDPQYKLVKPHITLVYPFEKEFSAKEFDKDIRKSIKGIKPFEIRLKGVRKSPKEFYLYLMVENGLSQILKLHQKLYSSNMRKHNRTDIPYIPHITLGVFKSKKAIDAVVKKMKKEELDFIYKVEAIHLINLSKNLLKITSNKKYKL